MIGIVAALGLQAGVLAADPLRLRAYGREIVVAGPESATHDCGAFDFSNTTLGKAQTGGLTIVSAEIQDDDRTYKYWITGPNDAGPDTVFHARFSLDGCAVKEEDSDVQVFTGDDRREDAGDAAIFHAAQQPKSAQQ